MKQLRFFSPISTLIICLLLFSAHVNAQTRTITLQELIDSLALVPFNHDLVDSLQDYGAYDGDLRTGNWVEYTFDTSHLPTNISVVKKEGMYVNGKKEGLWKYYKNYSKDYPLRWDFQETYEYHNGLFHGMWKHYDVQGKVMYEQEYANGKRNGKYREYLNPNNAGRELMFVNDTLQGIMYTYDSTGALSERYIMKKGKMEGPYFQYFSSGQLKREAFYRNDTLEGAELIYNEEGILIQQGNLEHGLYHGNWFYFYNDGGPWTHRIYDHGRLMEVVYNRNKKGRRLNPGNLKKGNGILKIYNEEGKLTEKWTYKDGLFQSKSIISGK